MNNKNTLDYQPCNQMETYILNKMEEKINEIQQIRQLFMNLNSYEEMVLHRNKIIQSFFNLEDDIRESYQLAKSTLIQNKDLIENVDSQDIKNRELETKGLLLEKQLFETNKNLMGLSQHLQMLDDKANGDEEYIKDLERRLVSIELKNKNSEEFKDLSNEVSVSKSHKNKNTKIEINKNSKTKINTVTNSNRKPDNMKIEEESYDLPNTGDGDNYTGNTNNMGLNFKYSQPLTNNITNYTDILTERLNNKKMINDFVNENLTNSTDRNDRNKLNIVESPDLNKINNFNDSVSNNEAKKNKILDKSGNTNKSVNIVPPLKTNNNDQNMDNSNNNIPIKKNYSNLNNAKLKVNRVTDIIMKLNSNSDVNSIVLQIFGENVLEELMSAGVDDNILQKVEETIAEIEKLGENDVNEESEEYLDKENIPNTDYDYRTFQKNNIPTTIEEKEEQEDQPVNYSDLYLNKSYAGQERNGYDILAANNLTRSKGGKTVLGASYYKNRINGTNPINLSKIDISQTNSKVMSNNEETNFENSLRRYIGINGNKNDNKVFKNFTRPYGDFFDPSLQKGGQTKIRDKNKSRSKSKTRGNNASNFNYSYISSPSNISKSFSSNVKGHNINNFNQIRNYNPKNYQFQFSD